MRKYLFDSDVIIWFIRGRDKEVSLIKKLLTKGKLFMSVVTITEVRVGLSKNSSLIISDLKQIFKSIPIDDDIAELAGEYRQKFNLGIADMFIAASCVKHECILVTYNKKHFPMKEVVIL